MLDLNHNHCIVNHIDCTRLVFQVIVISNLRRVS